MDEKKLEIPTEIKGFLESLLQDANMATLDDSMKEEMLKELYARLDNFLTSTMMDHMPAEHLETFIKMNEEKKERAEIEQFIKEKIPNAEDVFTKAFMEFRDLYLGNVAAVKNVPAEAAEQKTETPMPASSTTVSNSTN